MLFGRRTPPSLGERVRIWLWPRRNWGRSSRYIAHRLRRLHATPHAIALGCAIGVFASFTPFLGFHFILAGLLAWITRGSILASALGTFFGNPLTFPFMWYGSYHLGVWALGLNPKAREIDFSSEVYEKSFDQLWPILKPIMIGGVPLGIVIGSIAYYLVRKAAEAYRDKRQFSDPQGPKGAGAAA